jgi:nickel-dependent lactate racemase
MAMQTVRVPQHAFYGDSELALTLPADWPVEVRAMPGAAAPPLSDEALRAALASPIGAAPLSDLAHGRRQAAIIFDDISRPTPVARLWPFVVEALHAAGFTDERIRFVVALGTHAAHTRDELERKLGAEALRRFAVYNHDCFHRNTLVGTTAGGTPVELNDEVLACDLRIGIGSVLPHPGYGFGGGPKIILPGVVSYRTIESHHSVLTPRVREEGHGATLRAGVAENLAWLDIAEAARLAGLDFIVNAILNQRREVAALVAGDLLAAWRQGVILAKRAYATPPPSGAEVVIANGYGKGNEAMIAAGSPYLGHGAPPEGRDLVLINNPPRGMVVHYLQGDWGSASRTGVPLARRLPPGVRRMIVFEPHPELAGRRFIDVVEGEQLYLDTWEAVLARLAAWHPSGARVAVYPDLTVQYLRPEEGG